MEAIVYDAFRHPPKEPSQVRCTQAEKRTVESSEETDLNMMLRRLNPGLGLPVFGGVEPFYGDVSEVGDFRAALEVVMRGEEAFADQPADIRKQFDNDAAKFLEFVSDKGNRAKAEAMGLIAAPVKPEPEKVMKVEVVASPPVKVP